MSKSKEKKERELREKHERGGWYGLLQLEEIYDFACFLIKYDWRIREPLDPAELLRAEKDGRFLSLNWDAERKKVQCWRQAMGLTYAFHLFWTGDENKS